MRTAGVWRTPCWRGPRCGVGCAVVRTWPFQGHVTALLRLAMSRNDANGTVEIGPRHENPTAAIPQRNAMSMCPSSECLCAGATEIGRSRLRIEPRTAKSVRDLGFLFSTLGVRVDCLEALHGLWLIGV